MAARCCSQLCPLCVFAIGVLSLRRLCACSAAKDVDYIPSAGACGRRVLVGVDYYPEQWPHEWMQKDLQAIKHELGADIIRIGDFMWHELEPYNGTFNFTLLDEAIESAASLGLEVMLATPTASAPVWLYEDNPSVYMVPPDSGDGFPGKSPSFGGRRMYSFNSEIYRFHAKRIAAKLAARYGQNRAVTFWQVDNELGHEGSDLDFSENSLQAWRQWLRNRYASDIGALNRAWGTVFWSATYNSFDQIGLPTWTIPGGSRSSNENFRSNLSPGMLLDFRRFRRDSVTDFAAVQVEVLKAAKVLGCVTTNSPGGWWDKAMDSAQLFETMDIPAYDNYPVWGGTTSAPLPVRAAMSLSTVRGYANSSSLGWMIAEQLIGAQGHDIIGFNPRPGQARAWAASSLLHGATAVLFFRYRAAVLGQEQFCYGILDHTNPIGEGRKWQEAKEFYSLAKQYDYIWAAPLHARIALVYDMENVFAWQAQPQSGSFHFEDEALRLFEPFHRHGVAIDVISVRKLTTLDDYLKYDILLLPVPMLTSDGLVQNLTKFVESGRSLWVSFRADIKDEDSQIRTTPSRLAALAGVKVVEIESLGSSDVCVLRSPKQRQGHCTVWREGLNITSTEDTAAEWMYDVDHGTKETWWRDAGFVAVARRHYRQHGGEVVYVGGGVHPWDLHHLAKETLDNRKIQCLGWSDSPWLERQMRADVDGNTWTVQINHGSTTIQVGETSLRPYEVLVQRADENPYLPSIPFNLV